MIVTKEFLQRGISSNGSWNIAQVRLLGFSGFERKWNRRAIGRKISDSAAASFIELKDCHLKNKIEYKRQRVKYSYKPVPVLENISWAEQYEHPNWQRKRLDAFRRDSFECRVCKDKNSQLHAHHLFYEGKYIWDVPLGAIITVCGKCHSKIHGKKIA